jgi:hypothetical protein
MTSVESSAQRAPQKIVEGPRRNVNARRAGFVVLWVLAILGAREAIGYGLFLAHQAPERVPAVVSQHLMDELRSTGERATFVVPVSHSVWWSPRAVPGLLAATDRRIIVVGLVPTLAPPPPSEGEVAPTELRSYWLDSLALAASHSVVTGLPSVTLRAGRTRQRYSVSPRDRERADSLVDAVNRWQTAQREANARTVRLQEEAAELARQPVYHRIARGEALATIARQYSVPVDTLRAWNHLDNTRIRVGDSLLVKPGS